MQIIIISKMNEIHRDLIHSTSMDVTYVVDKVDQILAYSYFYSIASCESSP